MMKLSRRRPEAGQDENGAMAIMVALMAVVLFFAAALAVDISSLAMERQQLHDNVDAAAHAGAYELPNNGAGAVGKARDMALAQDPSLSLETDLWCIVASTGSARQVLSSQIPATCNPGSPPYSASNYPGLRCNTSICAIPCFAAQGDRCNSMRVSDEKQVPFGFASVGSWLLSNGADTDRREGSTGAVTTVACKGSCGNETPNPLDVVVLADRTASMAYNDRQQMKTAILNMLKTMTPSMHYVAFGTLHKSRTTGYTLKSASQGPQVDDFGIEGVSDSSTELNYNGHWDGTGDTNNDSRCYTEAYTRAPASVSTPKNWRWGRDGAPAAPSLDFTNVTSGTWIPVGFQNNYLSTVASPTTAAVLNNGSALVDGISCLPQSISGEYGTHLAGAFKGAVAKLLSNDTSLMPPRPGTPRKVLVFETDGLPDESPAFGNTSLTSGDVSGGRQTAGGPQGCRNLIDVAAQAKARDITVITIAFGAAATEDCIKGSGAGREVRDVLAEAASSDPNTGAASAANSCTGADIAIENTDGDYFFCAADGSSLSTIFTTAITQITNGIKFVQMPPAL